MRRLIAALTVSVAMIGAVAGEDATFFRMPSSTILVFNAPEGAPSTPADAAHRLPDGYEANDMDSWLHLSMVPNLLGTLYDRAVDISAISWPFESPAESQRLTLTWNSAVHADGCHVVANVRGTPSISGYRFQHRREDGTWSEWTEPLGSFDTTRSGNKVYEGSCGFTAGTMITALRVAPPSSQVGEIWFREFRASLAGVSAQ
ncbi:MAG: hypothetical protein J0I99_15205 [Devosia sp.]|uniref:hypothetical protein n=1 Tax=Devosia sp. TaxID=1871048 RepID=UPI001ACBD816|nr:hypothetical protein [Devosia sp.]MBN9317089.1 hypothetical protein [Devosia sp.]